ncbi:BamA/TamA family outer membrane protein [Mucilaginibacter ginsenosidivorans]|uniref:BamA/TamA family outer membrane protein n=1 Tax=Mucilaginibacter ginsenosidivorans TaxID=398053 RepID=A0A5B8USI8_9SPHI|nr:BamA/TamA family outer membrane protein [Mucilaginibacter ginsenosidivorans]QEC61838.1 BamA/TamA family outer membrane protein [Mucilaginibacter ginsenosidivorans]
MRKAFWCKAILLLMFIGVRRTALSQVSVLPDSLKADSLSKIKKRQIADNVNKQFDFGDLLRVILHPNKKPDTLHKGLGITVVPNVAANPTIGGQLGIKAVAGRKLGTDPNTLLSTGATSASITTKGIIYFYLNHNIFTPGNKWNYQGNFVIAKTVSPDHGLGIGRGQVTGNPAESTLADPTHKGYAIHSIYFNIREKVYKEVAKHLLLGAGLSFEIRRNIQNKDSTGYSTPSGVYNSEHSFPQDRYSANGFLFNVQYITRDNPNRAYKGIYFDAGIRANQTWIGSTKNALQLTTDFRKYFSLSQSSPEFVIAFWNWGSYLLSGNIPYLELPGTGRDGTFRSGRGYTSQYFKGTKFNDTELELRFPILSNKFISGVVFGNMQTGNDEQGTKLFQVFQPGGGAGLRVLFNKATRTNLALDYAWGKFGSKGFFLNLNEAF